MLKKEDLKEILRVGAILFAITAISALVLATVNSVTAPVIAANNEKKQAEAMKVVMPLAAEFEQLQNEPLDAKYYGNVYKANNEAGEVIGYVALVSANGYGGEISMVVGVNADLTVSGIDVISHSETAGLGAKCDTEEFKAQFAGKTMGVEVLKNADAENGIDAISSATITSKAVTQGVNAALETVKMIVGEE